MSPQTAARVHTLTSPSHPALVASYSPHKADADDGREATGELMSPQTAACIHTLTSPSHPALVGKFHPTKSADD